MRCLVIIPTYNEKENIKAIIEATLGLDTGYEVLVVDDGSPDGTADIVIDLQQLHKDRIHLIRREGKLGLGTAYIAGFKYALDIGADYIFEMDADFSHNPKDLDRLLAACIDNMKDIAIGSRYVREGGVRNWGFDRLLLSGGASIYVRILTFMNIKDPTAGFICYHHSVLEALDFDKIRFVGYAFQIEMKFAAWVSGFSLIEVPIVFIDRVKGTSKMHMGIVKEAILGVIQMRWRSLRDRQWYLK